MANLTHMASHTANPGVLFEVFRSRASHWKPRTLAVNRSYPRPRILPWFRGRPVAAITRGEIERWFASLHERGQSDDFLGALLADRYLNVPQRVCRPKDLDPAMGMMFQNALVSGDKDVGIGCDRRRYHEVVVRIRFYNWFDGVQANDLRCEAIAKRQIHGGTATHVEQVGELPTSQDSRKFQKKSFAAEETHFLTLSKQEQFPRNPMSDQRRNDDVRVKNQPHARASPHAQPLLLPEFLPTWAEVPWGRAIGRPCE